MKKEIEGRGKNVEHGRKVWENAEQGRETGKNEKHSEKAEKNEEKNKNNEFLPDFSKLENCFKHLNWHIKCGRYYDGEDKEQLLEERKRLLRVIKEMDTRDLWILYYVTNVEGLGRAKMLRILKKLYGAERRFWEELQKP